MRGFRIVLFGALVVLIIIFGVLAYVLVQQSRLGSGRASPTPGGSGSPGTVIAIAGMPRPQGAQLVDANGRSFLLHGAQIETPFNNIKGWEQGKRPTQTLTPALFEAMAQQWHLNALRLPLSNWEYARFTNDYTSQLDQVVQEANQAGLYVVLDLHDDVKSGSPYTSPASDVPKAEDVTFWKAIAAHLKSNPMVMFDLYNEPKEKSWNMWLHGSGTTPDGATIVGFQDLVNAVRSTGAPQVIVLEPGSAGGGKNVQTTAGAEEGGWSNFPLADAIKDPNIIYSLHVYQTIVQPDSYQSAKWGPLLGRYPIYYGEWAFLTNGQGKSAAAHCQSLPTVGSQADQVVANFLNYMASIHASWTAWQFAPHFLVQNYTTFSPTAFSATLTCGDQNADVGMGQIVRQWLTTHS
jgi:hypothetical protein